MQQSGVSLQLGEPDWVTVEAEEGASSARYGAPLMVGCASVVVRLTQRDDSEQHVELSADGASMRTVRLRWKRQAPRRALYLCDDWERSYGTLGFSFMRPNRIMPWCFLAAHDDAVTGYGVKVRPNAMCFWQVDPEGITLVLDVRNGGSGVMLGERVLDMATIVARTYEGIDSFHAARAFCAVMCDDPLLPDRPVYGSNNWYYAYGDSSDEQIMRDARYLAELTDGNVNRPYMVIDDCWQPSPRNGGYNGGPWRSSNGRFPNMANLAERVGQCGVIPGIWFRPLLNQDPAIRDEWRLAGTGHLDPTHPDALSYVRQDVETLCNWGYRLIKHDFSTWDLFGRWGFQMNPLVTADGWHFHDRSVTSAEVVKNFYRAILEAADSHGALVLGCNTIGHLGAGLMHISRTGDDTSGLDWERTRRNGINTLAFRLPQHNTFFETDADCVGISPAIDWEFNRQWADVVARSGTSLFVSVEPDSPSSSQHQELAQSLRIAAERPMHAVPLGWEYSDCPQEWADDDGGEWRHAYSWYEARGVHYTNTPKRYQSYLAFAE